MIFSIVAAAYLGFWMTKDLFWLGTCQFVMGGLFIALRLLPFFALILFAIVLAFCMIRRRVIQL